jgi:hypothetical protein
MLCLRHRACRSTGRDAVGLSDEGSQGPGGSALFSALRAPDRWCHTSLSAQAERADRERVGWAHYLQATWLSGPVGTVALQRLSSGNSRYVLGVREQPSYNMTDRKVKV